MVVPRISVDLLFETAERTKRLDNAVLQIELAFGYVAGIVGDGVSYVVSGHRGHGQYRYRSGRIKIHRLFITGGELAV